MSQFDPALQYLLSFEDPRRQFLTVPDVGGSAIAGINSHAFPVAFLGLDSIPPAERAPHVYQFYYSQFWSPMGLGILDSQDLANRVLDMGVNAGAETSVRLLQQAVNDLRDPENFTLVVDGILGPGSAKAANQCVQADLLNAFREQRVKRYVDIVTARPEDARYLEGWEARAKA